VLIIGSKKREKIAPFDERINGVSGRR